MKIFDWNVNGIRAIERKDFWKDVIGYDADIICLQETKAERSQLSDALVSPDGYSSFFYSSNERKGYSGVAVYSKDKPVDVIYGLPDNPELSQQGRMITLIFEDFIITNTYFPNGGRKQERLEYKMSYYEAFKKHLVSLASYGVPVISTGDFNVAHNPIDIARPKANAKSTGFLMIERDWLSSLLAEGFVDVFRAFNPDLADQYTYWDTFTRARERNVGWRIDYVLVQEEFLPKVDSIVHLYDQFGSDHCPILMEFSIED